MSLNYAIGIDLGGTKIEVGLVQATGLIEDHIRLNTDGIGGPKAVENQLLAAIRELQGRADVPIKGIGIGVAGQIDAQTGTVHFAPNLTGWCEVPLQENLQRALGLPVKIINDVRSITWGEWLYGAGQGCEDVVCLFIGTGIGGGIISGGRLLKGGSNTFGEVGHMTIDFHGPECTCGNRGCFEAFAGGWAIAKQARDSILLYGEAGAGLLKLANNQIDAVTAKTVVQAHRQGDPLAQLIIERVKLALIAGSVSLVNIFNPSRLIIGGGFIDGIPEFISFIEKGIRELALKSATGQLQVVSAKLGKEAGVVGAAAVILDALK